jgi:hypothetical protein
MYGKTVLLASPLSEKSKVILRFEASLRLPAGRYGALGFLCQAVFFFATLQRSGCVHATIWSVGNENVEHEAAEACARRK